MNSAPSPARRRARRSDDLSASLPNTDHDDDMTDPLRAVAPIFGLGPGALDALALAPP
jgi:hypothetical protein